MIINTGSAGALDEHLSVGDVVVSSDVAYQMQMQLLLVTVWTNSTNAINVYC